MDPELLAFFLMEEEEDEFLRLLSVREETDEMYTSRSEEGYYKILIKNHLEADNEKFRGFFRLNKDQFDFVLTLIDEDIRKQPTNTVKVPISSKEKLALTLR